MVEIGGGAGWGVQTDVGKRANRILGRQNVGNRSEDQQLSHSADTAFSTEPCCIRAESWHL